MNRYVPILLLLVVCITLFLFPHQSHAASIIRAPNNLGLVGYWSFDEGRGDHASDLSGNGNDGAILNTTGSWWVTGKTGTAVDLDGSNDSIQTDHWYPLESLTFSAWIYPTRNNAVEGYGRTIAAASSQTSFYNFWLLLSGSELRLMTYGSTPVLTNISGANIGLNQWHHVAFTTSRNGDMVVYVDGVKVHESSAGTVSGTAGYLTIGDLRPNRSISFDGSIDEVRAYSRELSGTEIQTLYNNTKGVIVGTTNNTYTDGLVAHYTFDGSTISGNTLKDVAGGNDGVISNATPAIGRIGQAMQFFGGGTNSYVTVPHSSDLDVTELTLATWIKTPPTMNCSPTCYRALMSKEGGGSRDYNLYTHTSDGERVTSIHFSSNIFGAEIYSLPEAFEPNTWHHVAVTVSSGGMQTYYADGVAFASRQRNAGSADRVFPFRIGAADNYWNGIMDDVRIYNRALSPEEIRGLAGSSIATLHSSSDNLVTSGLVGHWSFDEGAGTTVNDISGNGNDGSLHNSPGWTSGSINGALQFNGSSQYAYVVQDASLNISEEITEAAWVYPTNCYDHGTVATKNNAYYLQIHSDCKVAVYTYGPGQSNSVYTYSESQVPLNTWSHIAFTEDTSGFRSIYINGELDTTYQAAPGINVNGVGLYFGMQSGTNRAFPGKIDDVRIYSRALTPSEVQTLYSMGQ